MLLFWIVILFVISFIGAVWSLVHELRKPREIQHVKKELSKEKILFKR